MTEPTYIPVKKAARMFGNVLAGTSPEWCRLVRNEDVHIQDGCVSEEELNAYIQRRKDEILELFSSPDARRCYSKEEIDQIFYPYVLSNELIGCPAYNMAFQYDPQDMTYEENLEAWRHSLHPGPDPADYKMDPNFKTMDIYDPDFKHFIFRKEGNNQYLYVGYLFCDVKLMYGENSIPYGAVISNHFCAARDTDGSADALSDLEKND